MDRDSVRKIETDLEQSNREYQDKFFNEKERSAPTTREGATGIPKTKYGIVVNASCVKVRSTPDTDKDNVVKVIDAGTRVLIVGSSNNFYHIDCQRDGKRICSGYVMSKYIKEVPK